jgi:hypothetical protein
MPTLECVWICADKEELDIEDGSYNVSEDKKFETRRFASCSAGGGEGYVQADDIDEGGTSSSRNARASNLETRSRPFSFIILSIFLPTAATGARSQNPSHHFFGANMPSGELTSNIDKAASVLLKKAVERLENLS